MVNYLLLSEHPFKDVDGRSRLALRITIDGIELEALLGDDAGRSIPLPLWHLEGTARYFAAEPFARRVAVASCPCGTPGCGGVVTTITSHGNIVVWSDFSLNGCVPVAHTSLRFDAIQYAKTLEELQWRLDRLG